MAFGVTPTGFVKKTLPVIKSEVEDSLRATFGPQINLAADSVFGQIVGVFVDKIAEGWDVAEAVYRSQYPDSASDEALVQVATITGTKKEFEAESTVTLDQIFLAALTTVPKGSIVGVGPNGNRFETLAEIANGSITPGTFSVLAQSLDAGPISGPANTIDTIITPISGWSANAALTNGNGTTYALVDGQTLTVKVDLGVEQTATFNTADFADISLATQFEVAAVIDADITGLSAAAAASFVRIVSDLSGTGSAVEVTGGTANAALGFSTTLIKGFNSDDATQGTDTDTDAELRIRREQELRARGNSPAASIAAKVFSLDGVSEVDVLENRTAATVDTIPPHAFETVLRRTTATDEEIARAIFESGAGGIEAFGSVLTVLADSQGISQTIGFTDATEIDIFADIAVTTNTDPALGAVYPLDGDDQIAAALTARGNTLGIGADVIAELIKCEAFQVDGVIDITGFDIGTAPSPSGSANIPITARQVANFNTANIGVTS